jgi:hypothetical protein
MNYKSIVILEIMSAGMVILMFKQLNGSKGQFKDSVVNGFSISQKE